MKNCFLLIILVALTYGPLKAQFNLVPNPSFEDTLSCPIFPDQLEYAVGWFSSWNSPDYYNECDGPNGNQSVPNNPLGFQFAQDGKAYAGLITYSRNGLNYREHISCALISPMQINKKYQITYFISLGNNYSGLASNNHGILFSTVEFIALSPSPNTLRYNY
ncbi:MAG: hypothetical protein JNL49_00420 [Bacteroidia bacterium]|nr:hypothetical protein [Bacteroidia bacterium]